MLNVKVASISTDDNSQVVLTSTPPLDQPAEVLCETCSDPYCEVCFAAQHRKGSRKQHTVKPLSSKRKVKAKANGGGGSTAAKVPANGEPVSGGQYSS